MTPVTTIDSRTNIPQASRFAPAFDQPSFAEALVDPGSVFGTPGDVAEHPWFSREEKRTILLLWARDEMMLEHVARDALPELRPRSRIDAVIEALSRVDRPAAAEYRRALAALRAQALRDASDAHGRGTSVKKRVKRASSRGTRSWRPETCTSASSV